MRSIVVDAGPMIAPFDRDDAHHAKAAGFLRRAGECHLITNTVVVGEVDAMLAEIQPSLFRFMEWLSGVVEIDDRLREDLTRMIEIMRKYGDLPADLADVSLVALRERRVRSMAASRDSFRST